MTTSVFFPPPGKDFWLQYLNNVAVHANQNESQGLWMTCAVFISGPQLVFNKFFIQSTDVLLSVMYSKQLWRE